MGKYNYLFKLGSKNYTLPGGKIVWQQKLQKVKDSDKILVKFVIVKMNWEYEAVSSVS